MLLPDNARDVAFNIRLLHTLVVLLTCHFCSSVYFNSMLFAIRWTGMTTVAAIIVQGGLPLTLPHIIHGFLFNPYPPVVYF